MKFKRKMMTLTLESLRSIASEEWLYLTRKTMIYPSKNLMNRWSLAHGALNFT